MSAHIPEAPASPSHEDFEEARPTVNGMQSQCYCHMDAYHGAPQIFPPHWHEYIELIYGNCGLATVVAGGRFYDVCPGDLLLIGGRDVHAIYGDAQTRYLCVRLDPDLLYTTARAMFEARYVQPLLHSDAAQRRLFRAQELAGTALPQIFPHMLEEFKQRRYGFELALRADIYNVFVWILRRWRQDHPEAHGTPATNEYQIKRMEPVLDYLAAHYYENITAEAMSKLCALSYSAFCRTFKSTVGRSFTQYVAYLRITQAEKLLMTTQLTMTEIAMACGFSDASYFIAQFRRSKGISPKQFQKRLRTVEAL